MAQSKVRAFVAFSRFTSADGSPFPPDDFTIHATYTAIPSLELYEVIGHYQGVAEVGVPLTFSDTTETVVDALAQAVKEQVSASITAATVTTDEVTVIFVCSPGRY